MRHIKLAYAGKSANWELARYELGQMQEGLSDAYQGMFACAMKLTSAR